MAAAQTNALQHWARIIKRWPVDRLRPENVSFQTIMQRRIGRPRSGTLSAAATSVKGNEAFVSAKPPPEYNEDQINKQISVLYSLLENRYAKTYPLPNFLRQPTTNPTHYDDLIRELQEAPSRSWFGAFTKRLKGSLRLK